MIKTNKWICPNKPYPTYEEMLIIKKKISEILLKK